MMKLLLTSSGISNPTIHPALVDLLGKPISEASALVVPTGIYPLFRRRCHGLKGRLRNGPHSHVRTWLEVIGVA